MSVFIVCKNGEATIGRLLESARGVAREVVALDSGSTDGTLGLLEGAGARVQRVEWAGYIRTKQRAAEACTQEWVLSVDADESMEADLVESLRTALRGDTTGVDGYWVNRKVWYAGRFLEHAWQPEWKLRLVRRSLIVSGRAGFTGTDPHDELTIKGEGGKAAVTRRLKGTLRHDTIADMPRFLAGQVRLATIGAENRARAGGRGSAWRMIGSPVGAFFKQVVRRSAWRDGWRGWAAAGATACHAMMKQVVLMERAGRDGEQGG